MRFCFISNFMVRLRCIAKARLVIGLLGALTFCFATDVNGGGFLSGKDLLLLCSPAAGELDRERCYGYILGVADGLDCNGTSNQLRWSPPTGGIKLSELVPNVMTWLVEHPEFLELVASDLVARSLQDAYPCDESPLT